MINLKGIPRPSGGEDAARMHALACVRMRPQTASAAKILRKSSRPRLATWPAIG